MGDHRTVGGLIKEALDRYLAERRAQGEPPEGRGGGFWMHLVFALIVMLAGGDKSSQKRDIKRAQRIAAKLELKP